ncbi:hypothetical protein CRE_27242 [Caenorhabditis remanei]|uniref:Uncharacterized protein n=1 Tax=Caenorhabditis remanei TaxID=31234 RepID=E3LP88_CAERE|nr:hypothetical protein CRE_27242 [Caenorhabditis remanei]
MDMSEKSSRITRPATCVICGRQANGYHYDVIACKGCKTFFRRMYLLKPQLECKFHKDCFNLKTIKFSAVNSVISLGQPYLRCRSCRYQKCIDVGMNSSAIQNLEDSIQPSNREISKITDSSENIKTLHSIEIKNQGVIEMLTYLETKLEEFRESAYIPKWSHISGLEDLLQSTCQFSLAEKYGPMPEWTLKKNTRTTTIQIPISERDSKTRNIRSPKIWSLCNALIATEYIKTYTFFHKLSAKDQYTLARYAILTCINLQVSYFSICHKFECCIQPDGAQEPERDEKHYSMAVMSIHPLIRCQIQLVEYLLLKAIYVCNPGKDYQLNYLILTNKIISAVPDLSQDSQIILSNERRRIVNVLFDHCLRKSKANGPARFSELLGIFHVFERQQKMQRDYYLLCIAPILPKSLENRIGFLHEIMSFESKL